MHDRTSRPTTGENDIIPSTAGAKPSDREPTALEEISDRIMGCSERVLRTAHGIETVATRVMGQLPEQAGEGKGDPVRTDPDGTLDRVYLSLNRLDGSLARLEAVSLRLERV